MIRVTLSRKGRSSLVVLLVVSYALSGSALPGGAIVGNITGLGSRVPVASAASPPAGSISPSVNGEIPVPATFGGGGDASSIGVGSATTSAGNGINPETGDLAESTSDFSIPTFGPGLDLTRTYSSLLAQEQTAAGTLGVMGYGWSMGAFGDSLSFARPVSGWMYRVAGPSGTGSGDSPSGTLATSALFNSPSGVAVDSSGDVLVADQLNSRIVLVAGSYASPFVTGGIFPGNIYNIAGSTGGATGSCVDGSPATGNCLNKPKGVAVGPSGNLLIADTNNDTVDLVAATTSDPLYSGTLTVGDIYVVAGVSGTGGAPTSGGPATSSDLRSPQGVTTDANGNAYIADTGNNYAEIVCSTATATPLASCSTARYLYTLIGNGTSGSGGDTGPANMSQLDYPTNVAVDPWGNLYVSDDLNSRVQEEAASNHTQWAQPPETKLDVYTVSGTSPTCSTPSGDGTTAGSACLSNNFGITVDSSGNVLVDDSGFNELQEIPWASGDMWGQAMTSGSIYTIGGSTSGSYARRGTGH
jgi:Domain of unknown function (DUF6531)/NHL repeat